MKSKYTKKEAVNLICDAAKIYQKNLLNKNILYIYKKDKEIKHIETLFTASNFKHLTGLKYKKGSKDFFKNCLNNKISEKDIILDEKKLVFTYLKLNVLTSAMFIDKTAKRIGDYNYTKDVLEIEKVVGNVSLCIGFSRISKKGNKLKYYYPKTLLKERIENNSLDDNIYQICAILVKNKKEKKYSEITYIAKGVDLKQILNNKNLKSLIDFKNIYFYNKSNLVNTKIIKNLKNP